MRIRTLAFALVLGALAGTASAASEIIANFVDLPIKTANGAPPSPAEARDTLVNAASAVPARPWQVTDAGPGKLMARLQTGRRGHVVVVEIAYSPEKYSIQYRNSVHMNYRASDQTIHTSYNVWVRELAAHIDQAFGALTATGAPSSVPTPGAAAVATAPAEASRAAPTPGMPQVGDTWTYRATLIRRRGEAPIERPIRTHVIRVESASDAEIVDHLTIDGAPAASSKHTAGAYLETQDLSIFSPYVGLFQDLSKADSLGGVDIRARSCDVTYSCDASARIIGSENVRVAAGTFAATKIVVKQDWAPRAGHLGGGGLGGRTITLWYSPEVKRVVKYSSRATVGAYAPIDPHFDLELVSYKLR